MHRFDRKSKRLSWAILTYAFRRIRKDPPLDHAQSEEWLREHAGSTITKSGIGGDKALDIWRDVLAKACISVDHPRFFSYVPSAPTEAAGLFDVAASAANVYAGSWQEGAGAVFAENETLRWLADCADMPESAGGVFVSGGTGGNLSALIAARWRWRQRTNGRFDRTRGLILASKSAHSSVAQSARAMDCDIALADVDERGRLDGVAMQRLIDSLSSEDKERVFAVVATGGTTNVGVVDDLRGVGNAARGIGVWFHVDAAYGGAALLTRDTKPLFDGISEADSFIVDPHKWLFAPFDCCALIYREPLQARKAHIQTAEYLDALQHNDEWNPSDFAHHLSRRARGLPLWFSVATYGTDAYEDAVETTLKVTREAAEAIKDMDHVELVMEPELSIVVFRRVGWQKEQYYAWSDKVLLNGVAFVVPTSWKNETVLRICIVNPLTTIDDVLAVLESLRDNPT